MGEDQLKQTYAYLEGSCTNIRVIFACLLNNSMYIRALAIAQLHHEGDGKHVCEC